MGFNTQQVGNITEIQPATSGFNLGVNSEIENAILFLKVVKRHTCNKLFLLETEIRRLSEKTCGVCLLWQHVSQHRRGYMHNLNEMSRDLEARWYFRMIIHRNNCLRWGNRRRDYQPRTICLSGHVFQLLSVSLKLCIIYYNFFFKCA